MKQPRADLGEEQDAFQDQTRIALKRDATCAAINDMFRPRRNLKNDPENRWLQRDRVFFGFGACHILAGVFLEDPPLEGFYGEWIMPSEGFTGTHVYVTNGVLAFDFHGYTLRKNLLERYWHGHQELYPDWTATIQKIDFPLLDTAELHKRKHLGPDQYFDDPRPRAKQFIAAIKTLPAVHGSRILHDGASEDRPQ